MSKVQRRVPLKKLPPICKSCFWSDDNGGTCERQILEKKTNYCMLFMTKEPEDDEAVGAKEAWNEEVDKRSEIVERMRGNEKTEQSH